MSDIKVKYPASDTVALTITLASLANSSTLLAGRQGDAVDNTTNLDLDHILRGNIRAGTSPTAGNRIEIWIASATKIVSGAKTYPDGLGASDAAYTATSDNVKYSGLTLAQSIIVDSTSSRDYPIKPISIALLLGAVPAFWIPIVFNGSGAALDSTGGNHWLHYQRIQNQVV